MNKDIAINFRVDEESNDYLTQKASYLGISKSAFLCQIINRFEELESKARKFEVSELQIAAKDKEIETIKEKLNYFQTSRLQELFEVHKGKSFNGKTIRTDGDLLRIMVENFEFTQEGDSETLNIAQSNVALSKVSTSYVIEKVLSFLVVICAAVFCYFFFIKKVNPA
jgi:hypothetical protein